MDRDALALVLRGHRAEIIEADEWRPLADHVVALLQVERRRVLEAADLEVEEIDPLCEDADSSYDYGFEHARKAAVEAIRRLKK